MTRHLHRKRCSRRKAGLLLEFVMLLPITLILFMIMVDGARVLLVSGAVSDAAYRSARAGAVVGGAGFGDVSEQAFEQALSEIPGSGIAQNPEINIVAGGICTNTDQYVEIQANYSIQLLTPGLAAAFNFFDNDSGSQLRLDSTAVARCEIAP